jgi:hypothetical protein
MDVAIRRGKLHPGAMDEVVRRAQEGMVPILCNGSGFVAYEFVNLGKTTWLSSLMAPSLSQ